MAWIANDPTFRLSYPSGLQARYSLRSAGSIWQIDIKDFQDANFNGITFQGILQPISAGKFKMDAKPSNEGARPETFGPETVIFTKTGAAPALSASGSAPAATASSSMSVLLGFTAVAELTEPYYAPISADQYMQQQGADPMVFRKVRGLLSGPGANHLREVAGISGPLADLQGKLLLKVSTSKGHRCTYSGQIQAIRTGNQWQLSIVSRPVADKDAPVGTRLSAYRGDVYATDQPDQIQKISNIIAAATDALQKLEQARQPNRAEISATPTPAPVPTPAHTHPHPQRQPPQAR